MAEISFSTYDREFFVARKLAKDAGILIMNYFQKNLNSRFKEDNTFVTDADIISNKIIVNGIKKEFPNDGIVSEESENVEGKRVWYIDPLDGTNSFIDGKNDFTIHIGLCENNSPVLGIVFAPANGDFYYAIKNYGAFKENSYGKIIRLITSKNDSELIAVKDLHNNVSDKFLKCTKILGVKDFLMIGCTGLRIMRLVENSADLFIPHSNKLKSWDLCAPQIILEEAGGVILHIDGSKIFYDCSIKLSPLIIGVRNKEHFQSCQQKLLSSFENI